MGIQLVSLALGVITIAGFSIVYQAVAGIDPLPLHIVISIGVCSVASAVGAVGLWRRRFWGLNWFRVAMLTLVVSLIFLRTMNGKIPADQAAAMLTSAALFGTFLVLLDRYLKLRILRSR